ncbi:MAG TPA: hypothetical protein VGU02_02015, partial [Gaiellaceae bacterium]|nr:hypothetical protein [Gaiellaceae bacterium]
ADVEALFPSVLGHRLMLAPSYIAAVRGAPRGEVIGRIWELCVAQAPAPRPDWGQDEAWSGRNAAA